MKQTVGARHDLDKGAEIGNPDDLTGIDFVQLGFCNDAVDDIDRLLGGDPVSGCDADNAGVLDVDLAAGCGNDLADHLAPEPMTSRIFSGLICMV